MIPSGNAAAGADEATSEIGGKLWEGGAWGGRKEGRKEGKYRPELKHRLGRFLATSGAAISRRWVMTRRANGLVKMTQHVLRPGGDGLQLSQEIRVKSHTEEEEEEEEEAEVESGSGGRKLWRMEKRKEQSGRKCHRDGWLRPGR